MDFQDFIRVFQVWLLMMKHPYHLAASDLFWYTIDCRDLSSIQLDNPRMVHRVHLRLLALKAGLW